MKLSIPKPCPENWNNMTPSENGRHCSVCEKTVVDFTQMNEEEIKLFFLNPSSGRVCGRVNSFDLEGRSTNFIESFIISIYKKAGNIKYNVPRKLSLLILGSTLALMGCGPLEGEIMEPRNKAQEDSIRVADSTANAQAAAQLDSLFKADSLNKSKP